MAMSVSALLGDHRYATVELNATAVLQRLLPLVNDTQRLRGLTHRVLSGDVAATAQREEARQALDAGVLAFDAALPSAVSYHLDDAWQPLRQSLRELAACRHAASAPGGRPTKRWRALELLARVGRPQAPAGLHAADGGFVDRDLYIWSIDRQRSVARQSG